MSQPWLDPLGSGAGQLLPISAARGSLVLLVLTYAFLLRRSYRRSCRLSRQCSYRYLHIAITVHCSVRVASFAANLFLSQFAQFDALSEMILLTPDVTALSVYILVAVIWLHIALQSTTAHCEKIIARIYRANIIFNACLAILLASYISYVVISTSIASQLFNLICWCLFAVSLGLPIIAFFTVMLFFFFLITGFPFRSLLHRKRIVAASWVLIVWSLGRIFRAITLVLFFIGTAWTSIFNPDKFSWILMLTMVLSEILPILAAQDWKVFALFLIQDPPYALQPVPVSGWLIPADELDYDVADSENHVMQGKWRFHDVALHVINLHKIPSNLVQNLAEYVGSFCELSHPNLVSVYGVSITQHGICLVEEWMSMGNVYEFIRRNGIDIQLGLLSTSDICRIVLQIVNAMDYLAENGVVHGFLSCKTVFFDSSMHVRVGGAGLFPLRQLILINQDETCTGYEAPEILNGDGLTCPYSDVYSVGCIINTLCSGVPPFPHVTKARRLRNLVCNEGLRPALTQQRPEFLQVIQECWAHRPQDRPTFFELHHMISAINDEFQRLDVH